MSAKALRDEHLGLTKRLGQADSVNTADHSMLKPGDLAVTLDGVHVMVYRGERIWIEADPNIGKVVQITTPTDNAWFQLPIVLMRWTALSGH